MYDVDRIRSWFPALESGWAHFDGPGGTQTPRSVGEAIAQALTGPLSNRGTTSPSEQNAEDAVTGFRLAMAELVGADPRGIVEGRSATQLVYDFSRHLSRDWGPGDEIVVTRLDHDSNVRPWVQAAERSGASVRWIDLDPATGELVEPEASITDRTRLVAVTAASNLIGTHPDVRRISEAAHAVGAGGSGALVWVDGVHHAAHVLPDIEALGADFFVCSPYKFLGPHCGVLAAAPELLATIRPDKLLPATDDVPERFEFGTLPYELLAGVTAAVDALAALDATASGGRRERLAASYRALHEHEAALLARLEAGLESLPGVTVWSRAAERTPTVLATFAGVAATDLTEALAERQVLAPSHNFYALEASRRLGLGDEGGLRMGLAPYSTASDVDRLLAGLEVSLAASAS